MSRRDRNVSSLTPVDIERATAAVRIMDAYTAFGESLLRGDIPSRPPLSPEARRAKRERWRQNKAARTVSAK